MIGSKGDLKQGILGALTAGFNAKGMYGSALRNLPICGSYTLPFMCISPRQIASIAVLFIPGLNIYAAGFLSGMIGSKGDLKQGILGHNCIYYNSVYCKGIGYRDQH
jgi:hypothetical protein